MVAPLNIVVQVGCGVASTGLLAGTVLQLWLGNQLYALQGNCITRNASTVYIANSNSSCLPE